MFVDNKFNSGRVYVWYIVTNTVRNILPLNQQELLDNYFWKWIGIFDKELPHEKCKLQEIKDEWLKKRMC